MTPADIVIVVGMSPIWRSSNPVLHTLFVLVVSAGLLATARAQFVQQGSKLVGPVEVPTQIGAVAIPAQGAAVALSADGNTALVGAPGDGVTGSTFVYTLTGGVWSLQGSKLVGTGGAGFASTQQGAAVALSADGNTAIVGGSGDNRGVSDSRGVGAAWVFTRTGGVWSQQGSKLSGTDAVGFAAQGLSVALSADGNTAIVGGPNDNNANSSPDSSGAGAAWVYTRTGGVWSQQGSKLVGTGANVFAGQGLSVALSADGNTAVVGGPNASNSEEVGAVWVYTRTDGVWGQQGSKLVGTGADGCCAEQGSAVALSADGNTAIVGGLNDHNGGSAWVYTRADGVWSQQGSKLVGMGAVGGAAQGVSVALSGDGNTAIVGGPYDNGSVGAAWVYSRSNGEWSQQGSKLVGTGAVGSAFQGRSVALSGDGNTAMVGGPFDNSSIGAAWVFVNPAVVQAALRFVPVTPCRITDTRNANGPFGGPSAAGQTSRDFVIPNGACSIPPTAAAYSLNVAVVPHGTLGYLTTWPAGQPQPLVATLNSLDGRIKSNAAIVPAGVSGAISVYVSDPTDVILDINGYFVPTAAASATSLAFYPLTPCRIADTRTAPAPLGGPSLTGGSAPRSFPVLASGCGLPSNAQAYSLNFAAVPKGPLGFVTAWPAGQPQPLVASLNALTGTVTANAVIVPAGANGAVDVFTTNDTDLVIDINGYFAPPGSGGLSLYNLAPCRVLDTRLPSGMKPFSGTREMNVGASSCGVPATAQAYVFNATVVPPGPLGFITMWPQGEQQPLVATLNAIDGAITSNMAIVPTTNGSIDVSASAPTHLVLDIFGFFAP